VLFGGDRLIWTPFAGFVVAITFVVAMIIHDRADASAPVTMALRAPAALGVVTSVSKRRRHEHSA
jgi:hypothetical protein